MDYDKIYVNIVMLTSDLQERLFLPISIERTISSVFKPMQSLNIVFASSPSFVMQTGNKYLPRLFFVQFYNRRFFLPLLLSLFSAQCTSAAVPLPPAVRRAVSHIPWIPPPNSSAVIAVREHRYKTPERMQTSSFRCMIRRQETDAPT